MGWLTLCLWRLAEIEKIAPPEDAVAASDREGRRRRFVLPRCPPEDRMAATHALRRRDQSDARDQGSARSSRDTPPGGCWPLPERDSASLAPRRAPPHSGW